MDEAPSKGLLYRLTHKYETGIRCGERMVLPRGWNLGVKVVDALREGRYVLPLHACILELQVQLCIWDMLSHLVVSWIGIAELLLIRAVACQEASLLRTADIEVGAKVEGTERTRGSRECPKQVHHDGGTQDGMEERG